MSHQNKNPLAVGTMQGISIEHSSYFKSTVQKCKPKYFQELKNIPIENPIFISTDWLSHNYVKRHCGFSLFCELDNTVYELDFCFNREIWILYSGSKTFNRVLELAREIQWCGASKILLILIAAGGFHGKH